MAVTLTFSICESSNRQEIIFKETTGGTSSSAWGVGGNPETSGAQTATLTVLSPNGTTTVFDLFAESPAWPTEDTTQEFTIVPSDLGYSTATGTTFEDGLYRFTYAVTRTSATAFSYSQIKSVLIYGNIKCEVHSLYGEIPSEECDCNTDAIELAFKGMIYLKALEYAAETGNSSEFDRLMTILERITANNDCNNCN